MAKSRGRKFAELVAPTNGVFAAASIPTIALSKLASSTVTINSESLSLGGSLTLDTSDIGEHTSNKYFTDTRAQASLSVASNSGHGALAYDNSNGQFTFAGITTEAIQDVVGAMFSSNTETAVTVTYQDSDGTIDLVVDDTTKVPLAGGTMTGNLTLGDNVNAYFGASTDLRIYHDGTNSHIINSTGELRFTGSNFAIKSDSNKLYLGAGDDLQIYHDGLNSYIRDTGTGALRVAGSEVSLLNAAHSEFMIRALENGAVTLYYDSVAKFATTSAGVSVTGTLTTSDHIYLPDSKVLYIGAAPALALYHTGTNSHIQNSTGALINTTATFVVNNAANTETMLNAYENGAVSLYHDNAVKLATTSTGISVTGEITFTEALTSTDGGGRFYISGDTNDNTYFLSRGEIRFRPANTTSNKFVIGANGALTINGQYTLPTTDGTANQVLTTDGSGNVSFSSVSGSGTITAVVAGTNLTGGATSGSATVNLATNLSGLGTISSGAITTSGNLTSTAASTTGILGVAYSSNYFGLKTSGQTLSSEYMIISAGTDTYISATSGYPVYIRYGGNDSTNELIVGTGTTGLSWRGSTVWTAGNDGTGSGLDADTVDGIQAASFLRSDTNDSVGTDVRHDYGPNSTWSSTLRVGGNGYTAGQSNAIASVVTTNGNLHLDAGGNRGLYLNHYAGTAGVAFGSGSSGAVAWMGPDGDLWKGSADNTGSKYWHAGNDGSGSGLDADLLDGLQGSSYMGYLGMSTSRDDYVNLRVVRNNGSSAGSDGMYIGYGNAGSGATRIYGGGSTSAYISHNGSNLTFANTGLGAVSMAGTLTSQDVLVSSGYHLQRSNHHTGYLEGSYNNVGANSAKSNPIYSIGSAYTPGDASAGNMYGIGYSHSNFWGTSNGRSSDWGLYAVENGNIFFTATNARTWSSAQFNRNGNTVWDAGNDGSGSGLDADLLDGSNSGAFMKTGAGDAVSGWWIASARNGNSGSPQIYFSHSSGYGMHINTYNTSGSIYALQIHNNSSELFGVYNDGQVRIRNQLRIGAGSNDGYFYSDSNGRTAFAGGDFYIQNSVSNYYNYATNQYLGDSSGDNIYLRGNTMSGDSWSLTGSGVFRSANGITAGSTSSLSNQSSLLALAGTSPYISFHHGAGGRTAYFQEASNRFYLGECTYTETEGSFRAPIFYDTGDTAYYADIAGTSRYNYIRPNDISVVGNVDYGSPRWDFRAHVVESPHHYAMGATDTMYIGEDNTINLRDHAIAEDDCRAPIFYHSTNTTYYVRPGSSSKFASDIFIDGNYGVGIVGVYASTRYQHVWSMGAAYRTNAAGTSYGNMYGLTYTHTNVGTGTNQSIAGLSHQLQHRTNGTLTAAIGSGIWTSGNVTAYSDIAVKTNLQVIPNALEKVCSLHGYTYERTDYVKDPEDANAPDKLVQAGVVAQEVEKVLPEVVSGSEGNKNVAYGNMVSILIEAIKELKTEVDELKAQLNKEK